MTRRARALATQRTALALAALAYAASRAHAQAARGHVMKTADTVVVAAGPNYAAGSVTRFFLGNAYRDLWTTPVKVPVLNLHNIAGGLRAITPRDGLSPRSLRLQAPSGAQYVFRLVNKTYLATPPAFRGSVIDAMFRDQVSALHPAAALVAGPILQAAGVLHPTALLAVMPNDPLLGQYRKTFGGQLGIIEEYPTTFEGAPGFGGAREIIESTDLLQRLNTDPNQRIDARALLRARLIDFLLSDNDRHRGNWKWARMSDDVPVEWVPIPRDRDQAFMSLQGAVIAAARVAAPKVMTMGGEQLDVRGLTQYTDFDGRLLGTLNWAAWDSVARDVARRVDDDAIDAAVHAMPREYWWSAPSLAAELRERRDQLPEVSRRFYLSLATVADIHGTDAADNAVITREANGNVDVDIRSGVPSFFHRTFDAHETSEIRVYLHGGDDSARVVGSADESIVVRVIGGGGTNVLVDSSHVGGHAHSTEMHDAGDETGVPYGRDTLFNREEWMQSNGELVPPARSYGTRPLAHVGLSTGSGLGLTPRVTFERYTYGFERYPYASFVALNGEYAAGFRGWRVGATGDRRFESTPLHVLASVQMSELEVINFQGFGNQRITRDASEGFYEVRQRQWNANLAVARTIGDMGEVFAGPALEYAVTDSQPNRFISEAPPYGFGRFGQIGLRAGWRREQGNPDSLRELRTLVDVRGAVFPGVWDVRTAFEELDAVTGVSLTIPLPTSPLLVMRGGGKKLFGAFPFQDAAFIGGRRSNHRYAGDASLFGSAELRVPLFHTFFLVQLTGGVAALADASRVYVNGESPGGWHSVAGGGVWLGLRNTSSALVFALTNERGQSGTRIKTGLTF